MISRAPSLMDRPRRATKMPLDPAFIAEARAFDVNVSRACERGLIEQINEARVAGWLAENGRAIAASNAFADTQRLPLASVRLF